jgi:hypothetical protein
MLHNADSHTMDDCLVLQKQLKNMKATWAARSPSEQVKIRRDQKANRNLKQDDLNEMVAKAMQAAFQAELVKLKKSLKCKASDVSSDEDYDHHHMDSPEDCDYLIEQVTVSDNYSLSDIS